MHIRLGASKVEERFVVDHSHHMARLMNLSFLNVTSFIVLWNYALLCQLLEFMTMFPNLRKTEEKKIIKQVSLLA